MATAGPHPSDEEHPYRGKRKGGANPQAMIHAVTLTLAQIRQSTMARRHPGRTIAVVALSSAH
jgi:hypothetical protein